MSLGLILFILTLLSFIGLAVYYRKNIGWAFKKHNITWKKVVAVVMGGLLLAGSIVYLSPPPVGAGDDWVNPNDTVGSDAGWLNPDNAIDGNTGTFAEADATDDGKNLVFNLDTAILCDKIRIHCYDSFGGSTDPTDVDIDYWDGDSWEVIVAAATVANAEYVEFPIPDGAKTIDSARTRDDIIPAFRTYRVSVFQFNQLPPANNPPTQSSPNPTNGSFFGLYEFDVKPLMSITVDDDTDDTLNATWWSNSSGTWVQFGHNDSIDTSGGAVTISQFNANFSNPATKYWWSVNLSDIPAGNNYTNITYNLIIRDDFGFFYLRQLDSSVGDDGNLTRNATASSDNEVVICGSNIWFVFYEHSWWESGNFTGDINVTRIYYHVWMDDTSSGTSNTWGYDDDGHVCDYEQIVVTIPDNKSNRGNFNMYSFEFDTTNIASYINDSELFEQWNITAVNSGLGASIVMVASKYNTSFIWINRPDNASLILNDSDSDGLNDYDELWTAFTNPFDTDTDNDGVNDYHETLTGSDPNNWTDTIQYNNPPVQTAPYPSNSSSNIPLTPTLRITINDTDADVMNMTWWSNSSGSWEQFGTGGTNNTSRYFHGFETGEDWEGASGDGVNSSAVPSHTGTYHYSLNENNYFLRPVDLTDVSSVNVTWWMRESSFDSNDDFWLKYYDGTDWHTIRTVIDAEVTDTWALFSETINSGIYGLNSNSQIKWEIDSGVLDYMRFDDITVNYTYYSNLSNGTYYMNNSNFSSRSTTYYWSVNLSDGEGGWNNETYHFTTLLNYKPNITGEIPVNESTDIELRPTVNITVNDDNNDLMNIGFWTNASGWNNTNPVSNAEGSDEAVGTRMSFQRKSCYANGSFWIFYGDNNYVKYTSSNDGISWDSGTIVRAGHGGADFSIWMVNDTIFDYVYGYGSISTGKDDVCYRRGEFQSDGTINWLKAEQIVENDIYGMDPSICLDADGYPWITWTDTAFDIWVTKSSTKDGTWTTANGFPVELDITGTELGTPIPLDNGSVYIVYAHSYSSGSAPVFGNLWNGTSWCGEEQATTYDVSGQYYCKFGAVGIENNVHVVFVNDTDDKIYHIIRDNITGWSNPVEIHDSAEDEISPSLAKTKDGDLICFWVCDPVYEHAYFSIWNNSAWSDPVDWFYDEQMGYPDTWKCQMQNCFYEEIDGKIGMVYRSEYDAEFKVNFSYLTKMENGEWWRFGENVSVYNGSYQSTDGIFFNEYNTTYYWSINASDEYSWTNETYHFTTTLPPVNYSLGLRTTGIDYFIWMGSNTTLDGVADEIATDGSITWGTGEYVAVWNESATWDEDWATNGSWYEYHKHNTSGHDVTVHIYDVVRTYITDDSGEIMITVYADSVFDYTTARSIPLVNTTDNKGGNFTGYVNSSSTNLATIATTDIGLDAGEYLTHWDNSTYTWEWYIVGFYEPDVTVTQFDIVFSKVEDTETWSMDGV